MSLDHVQNKHKLMIQGDANQFYGGRSESSQKIKQNFGSKGEDKKNSQNASVMSNKSGSPFGNY